jgi:hypothetical protein
MDGILAADTLRNGGDSVNVAVDKKDSMEVAMTLSLISSAFADNQAIPVRHTCEGADVSPPLRWSGAPPATASFALVCSDPDAPAGTWYHWAIFDIPADWTGLDEAYPTDAEVGPTRQAVTDFKRPGYGGPCPPKGHGVHHYHFRLMALDAAALSVSPTAGCRNVESAAAGHLLAETVLTGTYSR